MFSIGRYHERTPCIRGKELLTGILENSGISKLWLSSDHVFVATNSGSDLYAFDVVPQVRWRRGAQTQTNDCLLNTNHKTIVEIIWTKKKPSFVYIVSETGATSFWEFLRPSHEWMKQKSFQLSNAKGAKIVSVKLHEESGNIVWCERRGSGPEAFCVCCRSIIDDSRKEKTKTELGATQAILHNCPAVNIFPFSNGICIHPCQMYLEKIFIVWTGTKDVKGVVFKDGKVEESAVCRSDFRDLATALVGCWSENEEDSSFSYIGITVHPSTQDLLVLRRTGILSKFCIKPNTIKLVHICEIQLPFTILENSTTEIKVFTNALVFGLFDKSGTIFLYDILSGNLLHQLEKFVESAEKLEVLNSCSALPSTVLWNEKDFWKLEIPLPNELVKRVTRKQSVGKEETTANNELTVDNCLNVDSVNSNSSELESDYLVLGNSGDSQIPPKKSQHKTRNLDVLGVIHMAVWLSLYGLEDAASVFVLNHIVSRYGERTELPETLLQMLRILAKKVFQNPSVLLALSDKHSFVQDDILSDLKQFVEELDQTCVPSTYLTPLNIRIQPFFQELFDVCTQQRGIPSVDLSKLSGSSGQSVTSDVDEALRSVVAGLPDAVFLDKMEILSLQEAECAVEAFVPENRQSLHKESETGLGKIREILRAEMKDRRWKRRRSPENAIVLASLFHLVYIDHPDILVDVLDVAKRSVAEGASKDEATLQDLQECVREFILEFLPSVWSKKQCDLRRIKIHADLLVRLGLQKDALEVFLQRGLWQQAADLYLELSRSAGDPMFTSQLYEMLLAGVLRGSGTNETQLLERIFELKPEGVELRNLFELCLRNIPQSCAESILIVEKSSLTIGQAREALGHFLSDF